MANLFRNRGERHLWLAAAAWLALVYASLAYVRQPTEFLRERNLLRLVVAVLFIGAAAGVAAWAARRRPGPREWAALAAAGLVYLVALVAIERHEERVHLLEYGVFGGLVFQALGERWAQAGRFGGSNRRLTRALLTMVVTALAGWGDEGIQALLPDRIYELRDAALNAWAGVLAVGALTAMELARARDRTES